METSVVTRKQFQLVGISVRTSNADEMKPGGGKIGAMWQRFFQKKLQDQIAAKLNPDELLAAYTEYESDANGPYTFILGCEVSTLDPIPNGFTGRLIAGGKYLRFSASGPMPETVIQEWGYIWQYFSNSHELKRAYTTDYEVYNQNSPNEVNIYIAVK